MRLQLSLLWLACNACVTPVHAGSPETAATRLSFSDFYEQPLGPRGLRATQRLVSLSGSRVRLTGFVARGAESRESPVILAPIPIILADEDESLADDLPASIAYVHSDNAALVDALRRCPAAVEVSGTLEIGPKRESDDRRSFVRVHAESIHCGASPSASR